MNSATHLNTPIALTIAGSDSGGGAGIQADLKAFSALGAYGTSVITTITAQNTCAVTAVNGIPVDMIRAQIRAVLDDIGVSAIKIGMLATSDVIQAVSEELEAVDVPIVLDPVMVAKSGDLLLQKEAIAALKDYLLPMATLLTPNLPEAGELLGQDSAQDETAMLEQGQLLLELGPRAVLMKGGHGSGPRCTDLLLTLGSEPVRLQSERVNTRNTHGTGCTFSASVAAGLAQRKPLDVAVAHAHSYLAEAIRRSDELAIGRGHGPVHHFHHWWQD